MDCYPGSSPYTPFDMQVDLYVYDICSNKFCSMVYRCCYQHHQTCPLCDTPRYKLGTSKPLKTFSYLSLHDYIQYLFSIEEFVGYVISSIYKYSIKFLSLRADRLVGGIRRRGRKRCRRGSCPTYTIPRCGRYLPKILRCRPENNAHST